MTPKVKKTQRILANMGVLPDSQGRYKLSDLRNALAVSEIKPKAAVVFDPDERIKYLPASLKPKLGSEFKVELEKAVNNCYDEQGQVIEPTQYMQIILQQLKALGIQKLPEELVTPAAQNAPKTLFFSLFHQPSNIPLIPQVMAKIPRGRYQFYSVEPQNGILHLYPSSVINTIKRE